MANYNNGGLTTEQIKAMQNYYGTPADGAWGKNSTAAAGGLSAQQAWQQMQENGVILDPTKTSYYTGNSGKYQIGDWVGGDVAIANPPKHTGSGGGTGEVYDGGLSANQIAEMQRYYGTTADGLWGKNSTAAAGGLSAQQAWQQYQQNSGKNSSGSTATRSGTGWYENEGLTPEQIAAMQKYYGTTPDGKWGQNSTAAAGGLSAQQAWQQYQQSGGGISSGNTVTSSGTGWYENEGLTPEQIIAMQKYYGTTPDGKWGQNSTAAAGGLSAQQAWQQYVDDMWGEQESQRQETQTSVMDDVLSFDDFYDRIGGEDYEAKLREAINASVQKAVDAYNAQQTNTEQDASELARQAYIAKLLGEKNMAQRLAAGGYAGGMTESAMLRSETNYQNQLAEIQRQRQRTMDEIQRAIENARLTGDLEMAQQMAAYLLQAQDYYNDYYQQAMEQMQQAQTGAMEGTSATGTTQREQLEFDPAGYSGGGYADNGGVSANTVRLLQRQINSTLPVGQKIAEDGIWGPESTAAAGGLSASQYLNLYENYMNSFAFKNR